MFVKRGLIPEQYVTNKKEKAMKDIDPKYNFLKQIRSNPKRAEIHDFETDKVFHYPSIYMAALAVDKNTGVISMYDGKVWRNLSIQELIT